MVGANATERVAAGILPADEELLADPTGWKPMPLFHRLEAYATAD